MEMGRTVKSPNVGGVEGILWDVGMNLAGERVWEMVAMD